MYTWGKGARGRLGRKEEDSGIPKAVQLDETHPFTVTSVACCHGNTLLAVKRNVSLILASVPLLHNNTVSLRQQEIRYLDLSKNRQADFKKKTSDSTGIDNTELDQATNRTDAPHLVFVKKKKKSGEWLKPNEISPDKRGA